MIDAGTERVLFSVAGVTDIPLEQWYIILNNSDNTSRLFNSSNDQLGLASMTSESWLINFRSFVTEDAGGGTGGQVRGEWNIFNLTYGLVYPNNISLDIGNDTIEEFNFTGQFNQANNRTNNLFSAVNSFLDGCTIVGGNCLVPFRFHSITAGIIQYRDLLFSNEGFSENTQTFQSSAFDTATEDFVINISFDSTRYSDAIGTLVYNGTRVSGSSSGAGSERLFSASTSIPVTASTINNSFYWEIALTDVDGQTLFNSTFNNQTVDPSVLVQCGSGARAVNYTTYDEADQALLVTDFDATFTWTLTEGSTVTKNVSVSLSAANNYQFCINVNQTFFINVEIELDKTAYTQRRFSFN